MWQPAVAEPEPERDGLDPADERWGVPWLEPFRRVPADAVWPRLMTVPHPDAAGSIGDEFAAWAEQRSGKPLRWWQRLVAARLLEVDAAGELVWETMVLSMARQLGKSWLLRELLLWRVHQGGRFGEPQDVLHTGKNVAICKEVQRPARLWARAQPDLYKVTEVNGQEQLEFLGDRSRWMIRAKEAVYGYAVSCAAVDEAWKVAPSSIEEGLTPTMVERAQPQLLLVSTAHRLATALMLRRRLLALEDLERGDGDLLVEWSAPHGAPLEDLGGWRQASPHWTPKRERLVAKQLAALKAGTIDDPEEPDPEASFRSQWLNQWPRQQAEPDRTTEDLLPPGLWVTLAETGLRSDEPVFVAVEDDYGRGAGVGCAVVLDDGRVEVDAWERPDWDSALDDVERLAAGREVREFHVGASMVDRVPTWGTLPPPVAALNGQTAGALAVFRDLAANGMLVHDETTADLDRALALTRVRESPSGLQIAKGPRHLVKAVVWAVAAAHKPTRLMAVR